MSYQTIENYGMIGNMRTVALVGMNGSIDWYCHPHFDSPSIFGAILDDKRGGRFQISVEADGVRHKQFYWPSTNVLVTRFLLTSRITFRLTWVPSSLSPNTLCQGRGAGFNLLPSSLRLWTTNPRHSHRGWR